MTRFNIRHTTRYRYPGGAVESFGELRVEPRETPGQRVRRFSLALRPGTETRRFVDYFGNVVHDFAIPHRHTILEVASRCEVEVAARKIPEASLEVPIAEARQIFGPHRLEHFDYKMATALVPTGAEFLPYVRDWLGPGKPMGEALRSLNHFIFTRFEYRRGATDVETDAASVARRRRGVCQDFAHFMLGVLRTARLPCRYVSGYIESGTPAPGSRGPALIGAAASHAWVEALLPGQVWLGLDPTNDLVAGERHVVIAVGRDYNDVTPLRGTYRGPKAGKPAVEVRVERLAESSES